MAAENQGNSDGDEKATRRSTDVFDVERIRHFVELMKEFELSELDLRDGNERINLTRGPKFVSGGPAAAAPLPAAAPPMPPAAASPPQANLSASPPAAASDDANYITSPMVGTFYASPGPDVAPFVKVGDQVGPESTVCIIEAMKVFNEIPAECSGKITAVLVENGASVEYGQRLFQVEANS